MVLVKGTVTKDLSVGTDVSNDAIMPHNSDSGSDRLLVVVVAHTSTSRTTNSVTYNSIGMTQLGTTYNLAGSLIRQTIWYLDNPATGSNNVIAAISGGATVSICATTFTGADATPKILYNGLTNTPHSRTITVSDQSMLMAVSGSQFGFDSITALSIDGTGRSFATCDMSGPVSSGQFCCWTRGANLSSGSRTVISDTIADSFQASNMRIEILENTGGGGGGRRRIIIC